MDEQAKQTPLVELLAAVPVDVGVRVEDGEDWNAGTTWHPVGRLCHEAATELRRLHDLNGELLEALKRIADPRNIHFAGDAQVVARAALAKATGENT
jgi:hypothetical protein